jgi:NADH-quinone oxidoreductase subunit J
VELAIFLLFAALALLSAVVVVTHRNPVYSTMSLVVTLVSLAALFVLLGAPFIAALQVLIYTGAILVLFLFVVMLLNIGREEIGTGRVGQKVAAVVGALVFLGMVALLTWRAFGRMDSGPLTPDLVSLSGLAAALFNDYLLTFELVGLLLLVAVIAATVVARKPTAREQADRGGDHAPAEEAR